MPPWSLVLECFKQRFSSLLAWKNLSLFGVSIQCLALPRDYGQNNLSKIYYTSKNDLWTFLLSFVKHFILQGIAWEIKHNWSRDIIKKNKLRQSSILDRMRKSQNFHLISGKLRSSQSLCFVFLDQFAFVFSDKNHSAKFWGLWFMTYLYQRDLHLQHSLFEPKP